MFYRLLDLSDELKWNNFLNKFNRKFRDVYFRPEYHSLYENNGDGKAYCFFFSSKYGDVLYPFLKNSINDLGYELDKKYYDIQSVYGYSGCIYSNNNNLLKKKFHKVFSDFCKKSNIIAEFIRFHPLIKNQNFSNQYLKIFKNRKTVILNLRQPYKNIFEKEYTSNNRNMIRKGSRELNFNISSDIESLRLFKKNYLFTMKAIDAKKYYYFSDNYFSGIIKKLKKKSYIINVFDKKKVVQNSMILFIDNDFAHYHLSGRSQNCKSNASNNFMLDVAIKFAKEKGCKFFHFGGGSSTSESDSLLKFKSNFSKKKLNFFIGYKIHNRKIYDIICKNWESKNFENNKKFKSFFLKYRIKLN